jgi:hypothetical protein
MKLSKQELGKVASARFMKPHLTKLAWTMGICLTWFIACLIAESALESSDFPWAWLGAAPMIALIIVLSVMIFTENKYIKSFIEENKHLIDKEI